MIGRRHPRTVHQQARSLEALEVETVVAFVEHCFAGGVDPRLCHRNAGQ